MKARLNKIHVLALALFVLLLGFSGPAAAKKMVPKVDNFILFLDHSGSMATAYKGQRYVQWGGISKISMAKDVLIAMNKVIPELGYQGGFYTFAPYKPYVTMRTYSRAEFDGPIEKIQTDYEIYPRLTPMGDGLFSLDQVLSTLNGKTMIFIISDGVSNKGRDPVAEATALVSKYGDRICFSIISFADTDKGRTVLKNIAALTPSCACEVLGEDLKIVENMEKFLNCSLYDLIDDETVIFRSIYFDFDKYNIKREFVPVLDEGVAIAQSKPEAQVVLEGHTDSIGSVPYNQGLSERRANSVKQFFVQRGVDASRIQAIGYGKLHPRYDNKTAEGRKMNRRVEIKFK